MSSWFRFCRKPQSREQSLTLTATGLSDAALGEGTMGKKLDKLSVKQIREVRFVCSCRAPPPFPFPFPLLFLFLCCEFELMLSGVRCPL